MKEPFYITTTLPYVNADPHLGHALEFVHADIIARYKRLSGHEVFFNTGTDEHGQKVYQKAGEEGKDIKKYVDECAGRFKELGDILNLSYDNFIRTTDKHHISSAQEFWRRCEKNGDIYKKNYALKYCVGCELEKSDSELENGYCPVHPKMPIEIREEENYFFRFSNYGDKLLSLYKDNSDFVLPSSRLNEITAFIERGLSDFSISRLKEKMPWGVEVPGDPEHIMYVWFDALVNYISALGWPEDESNFKKWWPGTQIAGKDNLRQQSAMWVAMLLSADLPPPKQIIIHGFITSGGVKMSKSLGNVASPAQIVSEYGTDALRYYLAREITPFEDGDFTMERFKEVYNANLANGLGNLVSRIMKMATLYDVKAIPDTCKLTPESIWKSDNTHLDSFRINDAIDEIWNGTRSKSGVDSIEMLDAYIDIQNLDKEIQKRQPFKKIKTDKAKDAKKDIEYLLHHLRKIAISLQPFMPDTAKKINDAIINHEMPEPMFLRKQ